MAQAAVSRIDAGALNEATRRAPRPSWASPRATSGGLQAEIGVSPVEPGPRGRGSRSRSELLQDTRLPLAEVAFASGFASVRRFNALSGSGSGAALEPPPRAPGASAGAAPAETVTLRLDYRPPLDWEALLSFIAGRAVPGVESVEGGVYRRAARGAGGPGFISS